MDDNNLNRRSKRLMITLIIISSILFITWLYIIYDKSKTKEVIQQKDVQYASSDSVRNQLISDYQAAEIRLDKLTQIVNGYTAPSYQKFEPINLDQSTINEPIEITSLRPLSELNSGSAKFFYMIDNTMKGSLAMPIIKEFNLNKKKRLARIDYVAYKDTIMVYQGIKQKYKLIAGARVQLKITEKGGKMNLDSPTRLAAGMELNLASIEYEIKSIGFNNDSTRKYMADIESAGQFTVESYVKVINALNQIVKSMNKDMLVRPEVIPYSD